MKESNKIKLYILLIVLVLVGSLNWGLVGLFDCDLVKAFGSLFGRTGQNYVSRIIYILVAFAGMVLIIQRDTYLPFLGYTVMPQPMTECKPSGELIKKTIKNLPPNVKVAYWASLPSDKVVGNPYDAYGNYSNQGVTTTDDNGTAILEVLKPTAYKVPNKGTLQPHIHYRYWTSAGMASRLYTVKI
jgi:uncharacterized membrane protein YuzA (DUF378 family)